MPLVSAGVRIKDNHPAIAVPVGNKNFIRLGMHMYVRCPIHVHPVVVAGTLSRLADLKQELPVAAELHNVIVACAFARHPDVALVIDEETMNLLRPVVALTRTAPAFNVVPIGVELDDRRRRHATFGLWRIGSRAAHVGTESAAILRDPHMILRIDSYPADRPKEKLLRHLRPERIDFEHRYSIPLRERRWTRHEEPHAGEYD
jgi:hypothetical protein